MKLFNLGLTDWYLSEYEMVLDPKCILSRIITVNKDNYTVQNEKGEFIAEILGRIRFHAKSKLDLPYVGDWVEIKINDENSPAKITKIFPRKTELKRKMAGRRIEYQMIATNINTAFIMQSLDSNFNINRMERYLTMIHESTIEAVILLSKTDLISAEELDNKIQQIRNQGIVEEIITLTNKEENGINSIIEKLENGKTYCLLGSSGVGKTSLLNNIIGDDVFDIGEVREKDGKGRHTTTNRHLAVLPSGGMIIDTPGMRELGNIDVTEGIKKTFNEIEKLTKKCKFNNCSHTQEPKCAVLEAIANGDISEEHYDNYMKLKLEAKYNEMSYLEKRTKDKNFGKMIKQTMKEIKANRK